MAIIIPSKNIYEKQNPKILKNVIEKLEINANQVEPLNEFNISVFNCVETLDGLLDKEYNYYDEEAKFKEHTTSLGDTFYGGVFAGIKALRKKIELTIPKLLKNKYIEYLNTGKDQDGNDQWNYNIEYKESTGRVTAECTIYDTNLGQTIITSKNFDYENSVLRKGKIPKSEVSATIRLGSNLDGIDVSVKKSVNSENNLKILETTGEFFKVEVEFLCGIELYYGTSNIYYENQNIVTMEGFCEKYEPISVEITIYGNTVGIDLQEKTIKVYEQGHENAKNVFSIDNNELIQTTNYYDDTVNEKENSLIKNYNTTLAEYQNGKETAEILCSISNYYDESGKGKISTEEATLPMTFNIGDEVVPMVMNSLGKDIPMSKSKTFEVVGVDFIYDGAVWQKLTLLQK